MSEFMERHTVSRLIGAPPGYVGFDQGGLLTDAIRKTPHAILLLDEIEKAHPDLFNILLQVMDHATLTDHTGRKADFRHVILIMTTNAGAHEMAAAAIGFGDPSNKDKGKKALERLFAPEFRNRLDAVVEFGALTPEAVERVVDKLITELDAQLIARRVTVQLTPAARQWLAERGYDKTFGPRPGTLSVAPVPVGASVGDRRGGVDQLRHPGAARERRLGAGHPASRAGRLRAGVGRSAGSGDSDALVARAMPPAPHRRPRIPALQPELPGSRWRPLDRRQRLRGHGTARDARQRLPPLARTHTAPDLFHLPELASRLSLSGGLRGGDRDGHGVLDRIRLLRDRGVRTPRAAEQPLRPRAPVADAGVCRADDLPLPLRRQPGNRLLPARSADGARARRAPPPLARGLRQQLQLEPQLREHHDRRAATDADVAVRGADRRRRRVDPLSARAPRAGGEDRRRAVARVAPPRQRPLVAGRVALWGGVRPASSGAPDATIVADRPRRRGPGGTAAPLDPSSDGGRHGPFHPQSERFSLRHRPQLAHLLAPQRRPLRSPGDRGMVLRRPRSETHDPAPADPAAALHGGDLPAEPLRQHQALALLSPGVRAAHRGLLPTERPRRQSTRRRRRGGGARLHGVRNPLVDPRAEHAVPDGDRRRPGVRRPGARHDRRGQHDPDGAAVHSPGPLPDRPHDRPRLPQLARPARHPVREARGGRGRDLFGQRAGAGAHCRVRHHRHRRRAGGAARAPRPERGVPGERLAGADEVRRLYDVPGATLILYPVFPRTPRPGKVRADG